MINEVLNCDCMDYMKDLPDNYFELAIVDPPYFEEYSRKGYTGNRISTTGVKRNQFESKYWDIPNATYFDELFRISKNQIIWGVNYYAKHIPADGRIIWDKVNDKSTFSKAEIASHSFGKRVDMFRFMWNGMLQGDMKNKEIKIHSCQKPVALYKWLLKNYAKPGDKILDTHIGSGSIRIACHDMGFELHGCELDKDYWTDQEARFKKHIQQNELFDFLGGEIKNNV